MVDRINDPQRIIGVSQGDGTLKAELSNKDQSNVDKLEKEINNE